MKVNRYRSASRARTAPAASPAASPAVLRASSRTSTAQALGCGELRRGVGVRHADRPAGTPHTVKVDYPHKWYAKASRFTWRYLSTARPRRSRRSTTATDAAPLTGRHLARNGVPRVHFGVEETGVEPAWAYLIRVTWFRTLPLRQKPLSCRSGASNVVRPTLSGPTAVRQEAE